MMVIASAGAKPALCINCKTPRKPGAGGFGLCQRCYTAQYRGKKPSKTPRKRAPGTWKSVQARVDKKVYEELLSAAKRARQSVSLWLDGAIRQRLRRGR